MKLDILTRCLGGLLLLLATAASLPAQIIIYPPRPPEPWPPHRPPRPPREVPIWRDVELRELDVDARVRDQVAEVRLSQTFRNPNRRTMEAQYLFPVPEGSSIQDFVLLVDGQELAGELMDREKARGIYDEIVRRRRDPALLEWAGRGLLRTSVFPIPAGAERTVTLRYTMLLPKRDNRLELRLPLGLTGHGRQEAERLNVEVRMESASAIKTLYSPNDDVEIERDGDHRARARLKPRHGTPPDELRLIAGLAEGLVGATLLSTRPDGDRDGYFLLLASPAIESGRDKPLPKTVIFVLDQSGSMQGKKIEQARGALRFVLDNLRQGDAFNIVAYDDRIEAFRPELQRYSDETRREALRFVDNIRAGGSTNIDAALATALGMLPEDDARPAYVIFLTDGLPTAGEKNEGRIAERARAANRAGRHGEGRGKGRLFVFGVGFDVNARLLDRLSGGNGGVSEFVKPDEDIEAAVGRFYGRMTSPVLSDVRLKLRGADVNRLMPRDLPDLFRGDQMIVTGRYRDSGRTTIELRGRIGDREETFTFPADLAKPGRGIENAFVERLWATRRIGELIDRIDMEGRNEELVDELVALSKRYGILTPYTSFLAREDTELAAAGELRREAGTRLRMLESESGASGVAQRQFKANFSRAASASAAAATAAAEYDAMAPADAGFSGRMPMPSPPPQAPGSRLGRGGTGVDSRVGARGNGPGDGRIGSIDARETIRRIGARTFYRRAGEWIDAEAADRKDVQPIRVEAYSDAWFELSKRLGPARAGWLAFDEPVTLWFEGKAYRIEAEKRRIAE
jgi:Ca-activated chloride channel family protein